MEYQVTVQVEPPITYSDVTEFVEGSHEVFPALEQKIVGMKRRAERPAGAGTAWQKSLASDAVAGVSALHQVYRRRDSATAGPLRLRKEEGCALGSRDLLRESDEKPFRAADVAKPIRVLIPDDFPYELRAAHAEPL
jgi:hypothetical protein